MINLEMHIKFGELVPVDLSEHHYYFQRAGVYNRTMDRVRNTHLIINFQIHPEKTPEKLRDSILKTAYNIGQWVESTRRIKWITIEWNNENIYRYGT